MDCNDSGEQTIGIFSDDKKLGTSRDNHHFKIEHIELDSPVSICKKPQEANLM